MRERYMKWPKNALRIKIQGEYMMSIIEVNEDLRNALVTFRGDIIVSRGKVHETKNLNGYLYMEDEQIVGCILYNVVGKECEIVSLDSNKEGQGIGSQLIQMVIDKARKLDCSRVWLITSNDNIKAISMVLQDVKTVF
jgi:N-acetylglutamate synthase-like GNAT family acetyltransferase